MDNDKLIFKKFANSFINEIMPLVKKHHIELTCEFQLKTFDEIAYLFKCKHYGILSTTSYRAAIEHVLVQDVDDIVDWLCANMMFICQCEDDVSDICADVIRKFPEQVKQYEGGKIVILNFLVGQVMKSCRGSLNADAVKAKLKELLDHDRAVSYTLTE